MNAKKIALVVVVVFLGYMLATKPSVLGAGVHNVLGWFKDAGASLAKFIKSA